LPAEGDNVAMLQPPASSPSPSQFPAVSPPQPAVASPQPSPFPNPQAPAPSAPQRTVDPAQIELLTKQGEQFVAAGDLVTARMVFQRAAEAGDAYAAMAMGATFDPGVLAKLGVVGMGADVEKARSWYQKAESMGSAEATKRLRVLAHR
jgi:predicted lipid-binding transport protein (Tim44 family)